MEARKKSYYNCSVYGCLNSTLNSDLSFFRIPPPNKESRTTWLRLIDREDLLGSVCPRARVCEAHFSPRSIRVSQQRKHLIKNTVPHLLLPLQPIPDHLANKFVQTDIETADKSLQCDFDTQSRKTKRKMFHELCDKYLTNNLAQIVKEQMKNKTQQAGSKFSLQYKLFCLDLYNTSPAAYNLLKETICLPSTLTLKKMNTHITTKIDNHLMHVLKTKLHHVIDVDRNCALVVGATSLDVKLFYNIKEEKIYGFHEVDGVQYYEPAKYAIVAMIHGLFKNYKQLVGFAFIAECKHNRNVSDWIDKLIKKLFSIGVHVRTLVTDNFVDSVVNRSVSKEHPYFFVDDRKIYYMFDPHDLVKLVRNDLMKYDFYFQNDEAKWHHIIQFYEMDNLKRLKLAPQLTESHIKPTEFEKMDIKYAVEVFSSTVASGLSTYRDFNIIENSVEGTITLIEVMNDVYNFLNTSSLRGRTQYENAFCGEEYQISFVSNTLNFFASLDLFNPKKGENVTKKVKFIKGFQITLNSLLLVFEDLRAEGHSYILTNRFNHECIENIFSKVRTRNKNSMEPTSWQLVSALRKMFLNNVFHSVKSGAKLHGTSIKEEDNLETVKPLTRRLENEDNAVRCSVESGNLYDISIKEECDLETSSVMSNSEEDNDAKCDTSIHQEFLSVVSDSEENMDNATECSIEDENLYDVPLEQEHGLETWVEISNKEENEDNATSTSMPSITTTDYNKLKFPENNALVFVSGYLLQKCLEQHNECDEFVAYITRDNLKIFSHDTRFKAYNDYINDGNKHLSTIPPDSFVEFVRSMEIRFCKFFESNYLNCLILKTLLNYIQIRNFPMPCKCFPLDYCKKLFIRTRIYHAIKSNNREYSQCKNRQKFFLVKPL